MQRVEGGKPEAVGTLEQMKELSHELWWTRILRVPRVGENQIVGANQSQASVRHRLVDHDLGTRGVNYAGIHQVSIHKVEPHRPTVGSTYAAELKDIPLRLSYRHILEALGRFANDLDQSARPIVVVWFGFVLCRQHTLMARLCQGARSANVHEGEDNQEIVERLREESSFH